LPRLKLAFAKAGQKKPARDGRLFFAMVCDLLFISFRPFLLPAGRMGFSGVSRSFNNEIVKKVGTFFHI